MQMSAARVVLEKREQSPEVLEPALRPNAIYFDTNPILGAGWPNPSAQMLQVIAQTEKLGFVLALPEVVNKELERHRIRELIDERRKANSQIEAVNKKAYSLAHYDKLAPLPTDAELQIGLRKLAADFTKRFRLVPQTGRPLSQFIDLAIAHAATFGEGGRGFQDAVILFSVLDDMKAHGFAAAALVSEDKSFQSAGFVQVLKDYDVNLQVVTTLDKLEQVLQMHFNAIVREYFEQERKQLIDTFKARLQEIEDYLVKHLTVAPSDLKIWGTVKRIEALHVISIENAHATFDVEEPQKPKGESQKPKDPGRVKVSVDVKVNLILDIERYEPSPRERLKAAVMASPGDTPSYLIGAAALSDSYECVAVVEAEATKTETAYSDISFIRAYLKSDTWNWLSLLRGLK